MNKTNAQGAKKNLFDDEEDEYVPPSHTNPMDSTKGQEKQMDQSHEEEEEEYVPVVEEKIV